jgi:hypothetical protein
MDMETSLAYSSAAVAALFAAGFFSLSALPRISVCRRSTSAAHTAFVQPGGLSFGARGFLAFGDLLQRHGGGREEEELQLWVYAAYFGGKRNKWQETTLSVADTVGPLDVSCVFVSSGVPEHALKSRGWPGLSGWMKAKIRTKTRNQRHDWTVFRRPDEKKVAGASLE